MVVGHTGGFIREACNEHLLGEFSRAGRVELALQEQPDVGRLDVELLGDALHIIAIADQPRLEIVDLRLSSMFGRIKALRSYLVAARASRLDNAAKTLREEK